MNRVRSIAPLLAGLGLGVFIVGRALSRSRRRMSFQGKSVVITGGSRGLGLVLARKFALEGAHLSLLARNAEPLARAQQELEKIGAEVLAVPCDISRQEEVQAAVRQIVERFHHIDVLINNAGVAVVGPFEHMAIEDFRQAMGIHFWGPLYLTYEALPIMKAQGSGRIVNVASIGGQVAVPHLAPYAASKFALVGFSDALRAELAKDGILVSTVNPGLMRTGSPVRGEFKGKADLEYTWFVAADAFPLSSISAERAADQVIEAARFGIPKRTLGIPARLLALAEEIAPNLVAEAMKLTNRFLPGPTDQSGDQARSGLSQRENQRVPAWMTVLSDQAAERNNELSGEAG